MTKLCVPLLAVALTGCTISDGAFIHKSGPDFYSFPVDAIVKDKTTKAELERWYGEPTFAATLADSKIEIYRELREAKNTTTILFIPWNDYRTQEIILVVELKNQRVVSAEVAASMYPGRASEVEFGLNASADTATLTHK